MKTKREEKLSFVDVESLSQRWISILFFVNNPNNILLDSLVDEEANTCWTKEYYNNKSFYYAWRVVWDLSQKSELFLNLP